MHKQSVSYLWMLCKPFPLIMQFYLPAKKKLSFAAKQGHGIDCYSKDSRKNKIQFCFIICDRKFVKPSCPVAMQMQHSCCDVGTTVCSESQCQHFLSDISNLAANQCIFSSLSTCLLHVLFLSETEILA